MMMMIFANPANLGLLQGPVDLYTDATFNPCTPAPFYQCLIVMIYNHSTSSFCQQNKTTVCLHEQQKKWPSSVGAHNDSPAQSNDL